MIDIRNVTKTYDGGCRLKQFSLQLQEGGCYALTAPSGWGKTTLLRLLAGLEKPDEGEIIGRPGRVSMVFQEDRLVESMTARGNIALVLSGNDDKIDGALALLGLEGWGDKPVSTFSGGMKRRVAIARAMMAPGELLLLDEPFKGLDEAAREHAMAYVRHRRGNRTLVLVTHDLREAERLGCTMLDMTQQ